MRSWSFGLAAAALAGCVAGNPPGVGVKVDAGEDEVVYEGGSFMLTQCGYPVVSRFGASVPEPGTPVLGDDPAPYHIHLGLAGPPTTSMVVSWATHDQTTLATTVQYGKKSGAGVTEASQVGVTYAFLTGFSGSGPPVRVHETHLCGLEPDTVYTYRVGGAGADGAERWSPEHEFRTAPEVTPTDDPEVTVLVLGDTRDGYDIWGRLLEQGFQKHSPDLILFTGDAVLFGAIEADWDAFFDAAEGVLESVPMVAAHGNHDTNSINFYSHFTMPGNEQAFGLDYGAFHLTMLNDTPEDDGDIAGKERDFLDADLTAHDAAAWNIVMHHKPIWSNANHGPEQELIAQWRPVYDAHHVDLVINGHDHNYERSHPMFGDQVKATPAEGTVYLVAGSAGAELYDNGTGLSTAYSEKTQNTVLMKVRKKLLTLDAYRADGTLMESFAIDKGTP
jgi:hypothetical protein